MRNKKLYSLAMAVTVSLLLFTGCGDKGEPVTADSESQAYTNENGYPIDQTSGTGDTSGEIVEAEKPVEEGNGMIGEDTDMTGDETVGIPEEDLIANDADEVDSINVGYTIIPIDDITLYAISKCNIRKGPSTEYDIVGSLSYAQEIIVNGKVEDGDKIWYVIKTDNSDNLQMVSAGLLSETKPVQQQSTGNTSNTGNTNTQQPSTDTQQPPTTNNEPAPGSVEGGFGWGKPITSGDGNGAGGTDIIRQ